MAELHIPVDFERFPEGRMLSHHMKPPFAVFLVMKLWVELAYQAQTTNRPGFLGESAAKLLENAVHADGGAFSQEPLKALEEAQWLKKVEGGYFCERFAKSNPHLSGDYKSQHSMGAEVSAHVRRRKQVEMEAMAQASLLPPEVYKRKSGEPIDGAKMRAYLILIKNLDNCLKRAPRQTREVSETLVMDAVEVLEKNTPESLDTLFRWIIMHGRNHSSLPQTTEQILANFQAVQYMAATVGKG